MGREDRLEQVHRELQETKETNQLAICAIAGMGGIGKTELALQYALKYQNNYPSGLCWLQVREADLGTQIVSFGRSQLELEIPDGLDLKEQVGFCWRNWLEGTALIVLDDVIDYRAIHPYLPPAQPHFKVLVTSRQRPGRSYRRIDLDVLSPDAALQLLRSLVGTERIEAELKEAEALCEWLGYLPLGLELVGCNLYERPTKTIADVQKELKDKRLEAKALLPPGQGDIVGQLGVAAAFELSWTRLSQEGQQLGFLLSLFALEPFDWKLVEACIKPLELRKSLFEWIKYFLLFHNKLNLFTLSSEELAEIRDINLLKLNLLQLTKQNTYILHQLIREFFRVKLEQSTKARVYKRSFAEAVRAEVQKIPDKPTKEQILKFAPTIPHITELAEIVVSELAAIDKDLRFIRFLLRGLKLYEKLTGKKHPPSRRSLNMNNLAVLYHSQGKYDEAESLYQQNLKMRRKLLGDDHLDVVTSLNNLAKLYNSQGRYDEAEHLYQQALETRRKLLGDDHPDVATSLNNLAKLYNSQGRYDEAEHLYQQALEMRRKLLGDDHPDVATSLNNLAELYNSQGRYDEAEHFSQQTLKMARKLLEDDDPDVATTIAVGFSVIRLATLYSSQSQYSETKLFVQKALAMGKKVLKKEDPNVVASIPSILVEVYRSLANLYLRQRRYKEAEAFYQQDLEIRKKLLGEKHHDVAISLNSLAVVYSYQERYEKAEPLYLEALELYKKLSEENNHDVAAILNNLAGLYYVQGRYEAAKPLYLQALELYKRLLGEDHPDVATSLNDLAKLYREQGRYEAAEPLYRQALTIAEKVLGKNHPDSITIRNNYELLINSQN